jgi:hypothetical protein
MSERLHIVRPDAKGRVRHLLKEADQLFNGPPIPEFKECGLLQYIASMAEGSGEFQFTPQTAMLADLTRRLIDKLRQIAVLLESGPCDKSDWEDL